MMLIAIILGLLPGFVWLFFYLHEDTHPEPRRLIIYTFLVGALFTFLALGVQIGVNSVIANVHLAVHNALIKSGGDANALDRVQNGFFEVTTILALALVEEVFKFFAAYAAIHKNKAFNEPVDAMIYAIVAALGFATAENIGAIHQNETSGLILLNNVFETATLRFVGATLLHTLTSAIVGYYWAVSIRDFGKKSIIVKGLVVASLLHALFNYLIILQYQVPARPILLVLSPLILLLIAGFFVLNDFEKLRRRKV